MKLSRVFLGPALFLAAASASQAVVISTWVGGGGDSNWSNASNWAPMQIPDNGVDAYDVTVTAASPDLTGDIEVDRLTLRNFGEVDGSGQTFTVKQDTTIDGGGGFVGSGVFEPEGAITVLTGALTFQNWQAMFNQMTLGQVGGPSTGLILDNAAVVTNLGVCEFLTDGGISDFGGNPLFENQGLFSKSAGAGNSDVAADFNDLAGQINVSSGQLRFFGEVILNDTGLSVTTNALMTFQGHTLTMNSDVLANLADSGEINFGNGLVQLAGTLTSTGDGSVTVTSPTSFSGGTVACSPGAPFIQDDASVGAAGGVTNTGEYEWIRGRITGGGLTNEIGGRLYTGTTPGIVQRTVDGATLTNRGTVDQNHAIRLDNNGFIQHENGQWNILSGNASISPLSGATTTGFLSNALITMDQQGGFSRATVSVPFLSTADIDVPSGDLEFINSAGFSGHNITVGSPAADQARVSLGRLSADQTLLQDVGFILNGGGVARWFGGTNDIAGAISAGGIGGELRLSGGTLRVPSGSSASLTCSVMTPFIVDGANADVQLDGPLTLNGSTQWIQGSVIGPAALTNDGDLDITNFMRISEGADGHFINGNNMSLNTLNDFVSLGSFGQFDNQGTMSFLAGGTGVFKQAGASQMQMTNTGEILKADSGFSQIDVPFTQTAGRIAALNGTITLSANPQLLGGSVEAPGANSAVIISNGSRTQNVNFVFDNDRQIQYTNSVTHEIGGILSAGGVSGPGKVSLGGTMATVAGDEVLLQFFGPTRFEMNSGANLSASQASLGNCGAFIMNTGTLSGTIRSGFQCEADFAINGGTINGLFENYDVFDFNGGTLDGLLINHDNNMAAERRGDPGDGFEITGQTVTLSPSAQITNNGFITHREDEGITTVNYNQDVLILNNGDYEVVDRANFGRAVVGAEGEFRNIGTTIKRGPQTAIWNFINFNNLGEVVAEEGQLRLLVVEQFDNGTLGGGAWTAEPNGSLQLENPNQLISTIGTSAVVNLNSNGFIANHPTVATLTPFQVDGRLALSDSAAFTTGGDFNIGSTGQVAVQSGSILTAGAVNNDGNLSGDGTIVAIVTNGNALSPGMSPGILTIDGDFTQTAAGMLNIEIESAAAGSFDQLSIINGVATLDGMLSVQLLNDFVPDGSDVFEIITADAVSGTFANVSADTNGLGTLELPEGRFVVQYLVDAVMLGGFTLHGDIDNDGDVDLDDYSVMAPCLNGPGVSVPPAGCSQSDFEAADQDADNDVDLADFAAFSRFFTGP